ncbi:MAG TPA: hypothetical protein VFO46_04895 [Candidatus Sulfotelmatobacter sp.]|nr:hypothetical protein [Candidatus Sulfotelmatobacter sp.]
MGPPGQVLPVDTPLGGKPDVPLPKGRKGSPHKTRRKFGRQFYVFLLAADVVVLFIYFFLVPNDVWESQTTRLRSIGALAGSVLSYLGLNLVFQKYVDKLSFFDEIWFRGVLWFVTPILWAAVIPLWSVQLAIRPPQTADLEVQIMGQSTADHSKPKQSEARSKADQTESDAGSEPRYRSCEMPASSEATPAREKICVLGGLLLRSYELQVQGAPHPTYLPAASILTNALTRRAFPVQLPCRVEIVPHFTGAKVAIRRRGDAQEDQRMLPDDGILWLMPGPYDYIRITDADRSASASRDIKCDDQVRIDW